MWKDIKINFFYDSGDLKVNLTGKAELTPKDKNGETFLKLTHVKLTSFVGDAVGRLVDGSGDDENIILS